jgi:hypothetical protein
VGVFVAMGVLIVRGIQIGMKMERLPTRKDIEMGFRWKPVFEKHGAGLFFFGGLDGTLHFRNLGCCDVSIHQVESDGSGFTAEVQLHAQRVISRGGQVLSSDGELKSLTVKLDFLLQSKRFVLNRVRYPA